MAAKEHISLQGSKILLIEDDKSIRLTVTESLVSVDFGYRTCAKDGWVR